MNNEYMCQFSAVEFSGVLSDACGDVIGYFETDRPYFENMRFRDVSNGRTYKLVEQIEDRTTLIGLNNVLYSALLVENPNEVLERNNIDLESLADSLLTDEQFESLKHLNEKYLEIKQFRSELVESAGLDWFGAFVKDLADIEFDAAALLDSVADALNREIQISYFESALSLVEDLSVVDGVHSLHFNVPFDAVDADLVRRLMLNRGVR